MTRPQVAAMQSAFRNFQRIKDLKDFPKFKEEFDTKLRDIFFNPPTEMPADYVDLGDADDDADDDFIEVVWDDATAIAKFEAMKKYFEKNWFTKYWLGMLYRFLRPFWPYHVSHSEHFTDIGLADEDTRDGGSNTTNFVEASWKTFDEVILEQRKNKRYD